MGALDTFLPPIENPPGLIMKLVYAMTRRQFGKVLTPVKVVSARLPRLTAALPGKVLAVSAGGWCSDTRRSSDAPSS